MKTTITLSLLSLLSLSTSACLEDAAQDDVADGDAELDETEQAVTWTGLSPFYQTQTTNTVSCSFRDCRKDLGAAADMTCFLAGIKGSLSEGSSNYPAGAQVFVSGTRWVLQMLNPFGSGIGARTVCIPNKTNRIISRAWHSTDPVDVIPAGTSKRRCFLGGIWNYGTAAFSGFNTTVNVQRNSNGTHTMGGVLPAGSNVRAYSTCVDLDVDLGGGAWGNGTPNNVSSVLAQNDGGVACGLTGIGGHIQEMNQGADITYASPNWVWSISAYGSAYAHCFK
ncbi:MAG: hypothetical protein M4D80_34495 [Myxococcota bacterium]|nr:hypothetical protein [Myxococcota bacterium]